MHRYRCLSQYLSIRVCAAEAGRRARAWHDPKRRNGPGSDDNRTQQPGSLFCEVSQVLAAPDRRTALIGVSRTGEHGVEKGREFPTGVVRGSEESKRCSVG